MNRLIFNIIVTIIFWACAGAVLAEPTPVEPSGSGTSEDPYLITTLAELYWITQDDQTRWNKHYRQTADIDASATSTWDGGDGWTPIGNVATNFTGIYDGDNHSISNLFINRASSDYQAFFGFINASSGSSMIVNLGLIAVNITGGLYSAGLVGKNQEGTVTNCYVTGAVNGSYYVGGLVGLNNWYDATLNNCYVNVNVTGSGTEVGGLVGRNNQASVSNCYASGSVTGAGSNNGVGGLIGGNRSGSHISNCYATGAVTGVGDINVGGLVGNNLGSIAKCYSIGAVSGTGTIGGLVGVNTSTVSNSFWDTETSNKSTSAGGTGKTTDQMKIESTFTDTATEGLDEAWNFTDTWGMSGTVNDGYPYLQVFNPSYYYMAKANGDWSNFGAVWFTNLTGGTDPATYDSQAAESPTAANSQGIIINADVTVDSSIEIDQTTVNTGHSLTVNSEKTLTIANAASDLTVEGYLTNAGILECAADSEVIFSGSDTSTLSGAGVWNFKILTLNKDESDDLLDINTGADVTIDTALTVTQGTVDLNGWEHNLKIGGTMSIGTNGRWSNHGNNDYFIQFTGDTCTVSDESNPSQNLGHIKVD